MHQLLAAGQINAIMGTAMRTPNPVAQNVAIVTVFSSFQKKPVTPVSI